MPSSEGVMADELPTSFRHIMLSMTTSDPWDHLCRFENTALLCLFSDGVKCKVFASTPPPEIMITCCNKLQRL